MDGEIATDITKFSEDYNNHKKPYNNNNNNRRKSKPKNLRGNYDSNSRNNAYNVVVITTGPNGGTASVEPEEECLDDNASVCSSQSSGASEHSVSVNKQAKKIRRVRCEIHSSSTRNKKDSTLLEEPEVNESIATDDKTGHGDKKQLNSVCTCSKNRTKTKRPEPEGSFIAGKGMSGSVVMSELDQILCSNEPLFSDMEDEKERSEEREEDRTKQKTSRSAARRPNVDDQKPESDRLQSRLAPNVESTLCVQMLNTNTSIKFAILQTELKNIKDRSLKRVEADITSISTKFTSMQELMDNCIETLSSFTQQLQQTSKFVTAQIEKEKREEKELTSSHIDMDVVNISVKQDFSASDLDIANNRMSHLERIVSRLESEIKSPGSTNANEMTNLKARHKEILKDMNATERSIIHISSCLHFR